MVSFHGFVDFIMRLIGVICCFNVCVTSVQFVKYLRDVVLFYATVVVSFFFVHTYTFKYFIAWLFVVNQLNVIFFFRKNNPQSWLLKVSKSTRFRRLFIHA